MDELELSSRTFRADVRDGSFDLLDDFVGSLVVHETQADLCDSARRDYGLRALACEAAADPVHLESRARADSLENAVVRVAGELRGTHLISEEVLLVERQA